MPLNLQKQYSVADPKHSKAMSQVPPVKSQDWFENHENVLKEHVLGSLYLPWGCSHFMFSSFSPQPRGLETYFFLFK